MSGVKTGLVHVPVSIGELLDKITILRIKTRRMSDAQKLRNVSEELKALEAVCREVGIDTNADLVHSLEQINEVLWDIEDKIREKERVREFDSIFIELARAVYQRNDERFSFKSKINSAFGSVYREEKSYKPY